MTDPAPLSPLASRLLDAQVAFHRTRLTGRGLEDTVRELVDRFFTHTREAPIEAFVDRETVKDIARVYASEVEPHGAIPELVGEIAHAVQHSPVQATTRLVDLTPDRHFREWMDKFIEMKDVRREIIRHALTNPAVQTIAADLIYRGIAGYLTEQGQSLSKIPGAGSAMKLGKSLLSRAAPSVLDGAMEKKLRGYIKTSLKATLRETEAALEARLTDDTLRDSALKVWLDLKNRHISEFQGVVKDTDIEELFVIGYEHWRSLRKTVWYITMIDTGIDVFFDKYGTEPVVAVLEEMGVGPDVVVRDAMRFAPKALAAADAEGLVEDALKTMLAPFWHSPEARAILGDHGHG